MKNSDLEILQLMRDSIIKANKDLGFTKPVSVLQEQKGAFEEEFDPEKHMPKFAITKKWGTKGSLEAKQIDAILANVVDTTKTNAVERYKSALQKLNEVLGTVQKSEDELPVAPEKKQFNLSETISSLQLKNLIHSIIYNLDPQSAGKIYELLMSRIASGFTPTQTIGSEDLIIADFLDGDGNFISLKTLKKSTDTKIKGSKFNLATAIAKKGKVTFLVNEKDKEDDPFKMSAFSFSVNRNNYFNFILGTENAPDMNLVLGEINFLNERFADLEKDVRVQRMKRTGEKEERQLSTDALAKQVADAKAKVDNFRNQKLKKAREAFESAAEGTPEKQSAEEKYKQAQQEYDDLETTANEKQAELNARRERVKKLKSGEKLEESLQITKTIESIASDTKLASDIYKLISNNPQAGEEDVRNKFMETVEAFISKVKADPLQTKLLLNSITKVTEGREQLELAEIPKNVVQASGKKLLKIENLKTLSKAIDYAESLTGMELAFEAETEPSKLKQYEEFLFGKLSIQAREDIKGIFSQNESRYLKAKQDLQKNFFPFIELYTQFANTQLKGKVIMPANPIVKAGEYSILTDLETTRADKPLANAPVGSSEQHLTGKQIFSKVDDFWKKMASFEGLVTESLNEAEVPTASTEGETKKASKDTTFSVSLARARKIALATKDAEYDENYPTIIVSATNLKDSSIQSMELFKRWAEPIYRGMHEMTNGINQYFIEDLVDGLSVAQDGIEKVDSQITKVSETGLKATELKEDKQTVSEKPNLKEYIKSSPLDDILEELLR